jgi:AraC family transcriptional regulator, L-rhamnose operon transcriptional activator RhaR
MRGSDVRKWTFKDANKNHVDSLIVVVRDDTHTGNYADNPLLAKEPIHSHDFLEISYLLSGSGVQLVNGIRYPVRKGDLLCLNLDDKHSYYPLKNLYILSCIISVDFFHTSGKCTIPGIYQDGMLDLPKIIRPQFEDYFLIDYIITEMEKECTLQRRNYPIVLEHYVNLLLNALQRSVNENTNITETHRKSLNPVFELISQNYKTLTLPEVSEFAGYNPNYFSTLFKRTTKMSFTEYINNLKLNEAIRLLQQTDYTIENICYMIGFKEKKHFYLMFTKQMGMTPNAYRKSLHALQDSTISIIVK